jgi:hypothetical protein
MTKNEIELLKRRIVYALQWYDEERQEPSMYVERDGSGRFKAVSWEHDNDDCRECSHGVFETCAEAIAVLQRELWKDTIGVMDFNFHPERHMDLLDGMLDEEIPLGWTLARYIRELDEANAMLDRALWTIDDDGNLRRRW